MDGNRRWARENNKSLRDGYLAGAESLQRCINLCIKNGIKYMTVYAFSTENWNRTKKEKELLMALFKKGISEKVDKLIDLGVRLNFIGRLHDFPKEVLEYFKESEKKTQNGNNLILNVAVSYGGRAEIVDAVKKIIADKVDPQKIDEKFFANYLYEAGQPEIDLVVRTSGEKRLSGFMLWQSSYAELYFTDLFWPEFDGKEFQKALEYYRKVKRNFGK